MFTTYFSKGIYFFSGHMFFLYSRAFLTWHFLVHVNRHTRLNPSVWTMELTHWGRVTHICVSKLTIIGSDNGLSYGRRQAIIWTNAGILFNWTLKTNFSEILIEIHTFSFKKMHLKMSSGKWQPSCLGLNMLSLLWYPVDIVLFYHA